MLSIITVPGGHESMAGILEIIRLERRPFVLPSPASREPDRKPASSVKVRFAGFIPNGTPSGKLTCRVLRPPAELEDRISSRCRKIDRLGPIIHRGWDLAWTAMTVVVDDANETLSKGRGSPEDVTVRLGVAVHALTNPAVPPE
jgi:hypothetical protein